MIRLNLYKSVVKNVLRGACDCLLEKITLITELVSVIICIHCVYGEKVKLDISTIMLFMILLISLDLINQFQIQNASTMILYGAVGIYCKYRFKGSLIHTFINIVLFLIVFIVMQFGFAVPMNILIPDDEMLRALAVNACVLLFSLSILPRMHIETLSVFVRKYRIYWVTGIVFLVTAFILFQNKVRYGIPTELFVVAIPILIALLVMVIKWGKVQSEKEVEEQEWALRVKEEKHYDELLEDLRVKQHAFKNHVTAIFSAR